MWISRVAFEGLLAAHQREVNGLRAEAAYLRQELREATAHNRRLERVDRALPELEPRRRPNDVPDERPPAPVQRLIALYDSDHSRSAIMSSIRVARGLGDSWPTIEQKLKGDLPPYILRRLEEKEDDAPAAQ
jgi:hypothetical protein